MRTIVFVFCFLLFICKPKHQFKHWDLAFVVILKYLIVYMKRVEKKGGLRPPPPLSVL